MHIIWLFGTKLSASIWLMFRCSQRNILNYKITYTNLNDIIIELKKHLFALPINHYSKKKGLDFGFYGCHFLHMPRNSALKRRFGNPVTNYWSLPRWSAFSSQLTWQNGIVFIADLTYFPQCIIEEKSGEGKLKVGLGRV